MPAGTAIAAPNLPEKYSPKETDKYITPIIVLAIDSGDNLELSEKDTGPKFSSANSINK